MIIDGLLADWADDWFGLKQPSNAEWNGHSVQTLSGSSDHRNNAMLAMMKQPSEASFKGAYSQEHGFSAEGTITWRNDPGPPPPSRERENSYEKERSHNDKDSSSKESSTKESKSDDE